MAIQEYSAICPVPITTVVIPKKKARRLRARALTNARKFGIPDAEWYSWRRRGVGLGGDLLMVLDPEYEAERIIAARR